MIAYSFCRMGRWGNILPAEDYKDAAVIIVAAYEKDPTIEEYAIYQRRTVTCSWEKIGGARREHGWSARGVT